MRDRIRALVLAALACVAGITAAFGGPAEAQGPPKKTVLVLYGDALSIPANRTIEQGPTAALARARPGSLEVFSEYLDLTRFPAARYGDAVAGYLRARYETRKPDALITVSNHTLQFVLDHRDELFAGVPVVFTGVDHREVEGKALPPGVSGLWMAWDYQRTLQLALQLQPKTREVICVAGTGVEEQAWNQEARKVLERFASRISIRWLDQLPLRAVLDEVGRLPLDSVVLYIPMSHDGAGQSVSPIEVARQLAGASRVPVYGLSGPQLEQGLIGGALVDFSEVGSKTAALALRVLAGERLPVLTAPDPAAYLLVINWRALKKWHVAESRIPAEAAVRYRRPSLWQQHPRLIVATAAVVGLQSLLIARLIVQGAKRKRAEASLRESEQYMRLAADAAGLVMWAWDIPRNETWTSGQGYALFGFASSDKLGIERFLQALPSQDREAVHQALDRALNGQGEYESEYRIVSPDGKLRWMTGRGRVEFQGGKPLRLRGVSLDITRRKQAEERFRVVFEAAPNAMIVADAAGKITLANPQVEAVFGYSRQELVGQPVEVLVPDRFRAQHARERYGYLASAEARAMGAGRDLYGRRKDGSEVPVEIGLNPLDTPEGVFVLASIIDITERRRAELEAARQRNELAHLSRVMLLGELSGSLAHELSQPLTAILSNAQAGQVLLAQGTADAAELQEILNDIVGESNHATEVIRRLRPLLKKGKAQRQPLDLNEVVQNVLKLARSDLARQRVAVEVDLARHLPAVPGDAVQLQQVLLNLLINGCDAMAGVEEPERRLLVRTEPEDGQAIRVSVTDHGGGIPVGKLERIFEPFFTMKAKGMGLGLAVCRTIISAHGGRLWATNNPSRGATFQFTLPLKGPDRA